MAEEKEVEDVSKKCAQTGTSLKRAKRYYRNGLYFVNKNAFKERIKKLEGELTKAEGEQAEKALAEKPKEAK